MQHSLLVPTYHMDGAFQTASALFRLNQGELPGRDFLPYLGIGVNFIIYIIFKLFGSSLTDTVSASFFVIYLTLLLSLTTLILLIWRKQNFFIALGFATLLSLTIILYNSQIKAIPFIDSQLIYILDHITNPGASLRFLRSVLPFFLILINYRVLVKINYQIKDCIYLGITSALSLLWSNDYAYTSLGLFVVLVSICIFRQSNRDKFKLFINYCITLIICSLIYYVAATGGEPLNMLAYNFSDVRQDQWWYYGPYTDAVHITSIDKLINIILGFKKMFISPFFIILLIIFYIKTKQTEFLLLCYIGASLFAGSLISSIGGRFALFYFYGNLFWVITVCLLYACRFLYILSRLIVIKFDLTILRKLDLRSIYIIFSLLYIGVCYKAYSQYKANKICLEQSKTHTYNEDFEGYIHNDWIPYLHFIQANSNKKILEDYWGIWSSHIHDSSVTQNVDSIIHALGKQRDVYNKLIDRSDYIITSRNFNEYVFWSLSQNYSFYRILLSQWKPIFESPLSVVWERSNISYIREPVVATVLDGGRAIQINCNQPSYFDVELTIEIADSSKRLIMMRNNINYVDGAGGYFSLNPYKQKQCVIVYATPQQNIFELKLYKDGTTRAKITKVTVRRIDSLPASIAPVLIN